MSETISDEDLQAMVDELDEKTRILKEYRKGLLDAGIRLDITLITCPFCGSRGVTSTTELDGVKYTVIGCVTRRCREYIHAQSCAVPPDQVDNLVKCWNNRVTRQG